jgi:hypothetical protein
VTFYREHHEDTHSEEELLEQLKGDVDDQISEYNLPQLVTRMLSFEGELEIPIIVDRVDLGIGQMSHAALAKPAITQ